MRRALTERVKKLREKVLVPPEICMERPYLMTQSYKETESEPIVMRRAKALEKVLREMSIYIEDEELIVGRIASKARGGLLFPEIYCCIDARSHHTPWSLTPNRVATSKARRANRCPCPLWKTKRLIY